MKISDDELISRYFQSNRSVKEIAKEENVTIQAVYWRLDKLGVKRRTNSQAHIGIRPSNYKGGWIDANGYHCQWTNGKTVRTHRSVLKVLPSEVVHHKNHNRSDNRLDNLEIISSQSEHMKKHLTSEEARRRGKIGNDVRYGRAALKAVGAE